MLSPEIKIYKKENLIEKPRAVLLITHGLGEHSHRYDEWVFDLNQEGISVFRYDLPGHGRSRTDSWLFKNFNVLIDALKSRYQTARLYASDHNVPLFLFGHSMGGLVTADYVIRLAPEVTGVILSAPALDSGEVVKPWMIKVVGWVRKVFPGFPVLRIPPELLSRDPEVVKGYEEDPLVYHGKIRAATGYELLTRTKTVNENAKKFNAPVLMLQGQADKVVRPQVSKSFFDQLTVQDKTWHSYAGMYHEILNDTGNKRVKDDILKWLARRIG